MITFTMDPQANAVYVGINNNRVETTVEIGGLNVDLDHRGLAVGIEILNVGASGEGKPRGPDPQHTQEGEQESR